MFTALRLTKLKNLGSSGIPNCLESQLHALLKIGVFDDYTATYTLTMSSFEESEEEEQTLQSRGP